MALLQKRSADLVGAFPNVTPTAAAIDFGETQHPHLLP